MSCAVKELVESTLRVVPDVDTEHVTLEVFDTIKDNPSLMEDYRVCLNDLEKVVCHGSSLTCLHSTIGKEVCRQTGRESSGERVLTGHRFPKSYSLLRPKRNGR